MISLCLKGRIVFDDKNCAFLGPKQFDILSAVFAAESEGITTDHLAACVWSDGRYPANRHQTLKTNICHLNHHLDRFGAKIRITGQSYRLYQDLPA